MRWSVFGVRGVAVAAATVAGLVVAMQPAGAVGGNGVGDGVTYMRPFNAAHQDAHGKPGGGGGGTNNLLYRGGVNDNGSLVGVEVPQTNSHATVYLVLWGQQWPGNDPSGEAGILQSFYSGVGGSSWLNSVAQYCQGIASSSSTCPTNAAFADGNIQFGNVWADTSVVAPSRASQSQIAAEAVRAANHFGATPSMLLNSQFVIASPKGFDPSGFGTQYCAWHSSVSTTAGYLAYTNLPYMTDGGASCGAGFNGLSQTAGITIVGGHEMAESITDQFPNGGWLDGQGEENGDKCAWISGSSTTPAASKNVTFLNGSSFPVQSLWSNAAGGCVTSS